MLSSNITNKILECACRGWVWGRGGRRGRELGGKKCGFWGGGVVCAFCFGAYRTVDGFTIHFILIFFVFRCFSLTTGDERVQFSIVLIVC